MNSRNFSLIELDLSGVFLIETKRYYDDRGFFSEVYKDSALKEAGMDFVAVQDNHSMSVRRGTVRGLHYQAPPVAQAKLVRVVHGSVADVAVDMRRGSPSFGRHVITTLSADNWRQLLVPVGFAHGFCTLEDNTEVLYKVSAPYSQEHDCGIAWDDPDVAINWPVNESEAILSAKDRALPRLIAIETPFDVGC